MTTPPPPPSQPVPPGQQVPPPPASPLDDPLLALAVSELLLTAVSAAAMIAALKLRFALTAVMWSALEGAAGVAVASPPPVTGIIGHASAQTGRQNLARRAQFVLSAAKRLTGDIAAWRARHATPPEPPPPAVPASVQALRQNVLRRSQFIEAKRRRLQADIDAAEAAGRMQALQAGLARERRYYSMHLAAMWNRSVAAGKVDMAAAEHGDLLRWNTVLDARTSPECRAMDGKLFRASRMPAIGFPGAVHPHCRCYATSPAENRVYARAA